MKRKINLLLGLLMSFSLLLTAGCNGCDFGGGTSTSGSNLDSDSQDSSSIEEGIKKEELGSLVENGQSQYSIVIPKMAGECITFAAEELKNYIDEVTGSNMSIVADDVASASNGKYISLGDTTLLQASGITFDYSTLNYDGFFVKTVDDDLYINGAVVGGTLNGVYDFLEKYVGVKFLTTNYTYLPDTDSITLYKANYVESPDFALRDYYANQTMGNKLYAARMRLNSKYGATPTKYGENGSNAYVNGDGHNLLGEVDPLVPYSVYGAAHSDWYYKNGAELCYTNGITDDDKFDSEDTNSLVYNIIEIAKEKILANPSARYFMMGQPDNGEWCNCNRCTASLERNGQRSGTLVIFMNAIAEQIENWMIEEGIDRDIMFITFAYWKTLDAPAELVDGEWVPYNENVIARDNVAIKLAHMTCTYHDLNQGDVCSKNQTADNLFQSWSTITDTLLVWDYCTNFTQHFFWYPSFNSIARNLQYYRDLGVVEVMTQGAPHVGNYYQGHLYGYLYSKLMWDCDQDVNKLIDEFNYYYFGAESSEVVDDFVDLMFYHYATLGDDYHNELYDSMNFLNFDNYPIGFLEKAERMLETEIAAVETREGITDAERVELISHLKQVLLHPKYMILHNYDAYYDVAGKKAYAADVLGIIDELGIGYYGEGASVGDLKTLYGVA